MNNEKLDKQQAIINAFTDQGKTTETNFVSAIEPIKKLTACKGRHTYINKGGGLWKCNCGKQLL